MNSVVTDPTDDLYWLGQGDGHQQTYEPHEPQARRLLRLLLSVRNTRYNSGGSLRIIGARVMLPHKRAPGPLGIRLVVSEINCCAIGSNVLMLNVLPEWHFEDVWHRCPRSAILRHRHSSGVSLK